MKLTYILSSIPCMALLLAPFIANQVTPKILGLPFLLFWIVIWIVLTTCIMYVVYKLENRES